MPSFLRKLVGGAMRNVRASGKHARQGCRSRCCGKAGCCEGAGFLGPGCSCVTIDTDRCCDCGQEYVVTAHVEAQIVLFDGVPVINPDVSLSYDFSRTATYTLDHVFKVACNPSGPPIITDLSLSASMVVTIAATGQTITRTGTLLEPNNFGLFGARQHPYNCPPNVCTILLDAENQLELTGSGLNLSQLLIAGGPNTYRIPQCSGSFDYGLTEPPLPFGVGFTDLGFTWDAQQTCDLATLDSTGQGVFWGWTDPNTVQAVGNLSSHIQGRISVSNRIPCTPDPCNGVVPPINGACCGFFPFSFQDKNCLITTQDSCGVLGGAWRGAGTDCHTAHCPQTGACCLPNGTCIPNTLANCLALGGRFLGPSTRCTPFGSSCPQTGGCCTPDGSGGFACSITTQAGCLAHSGSYRGDGTDCFGSPCDPRGACCIQNADRSYSCFENDTQVQCDARPGISAVWAPGLPCHGPSFDCPSPPGLEALF